jgi:hypothetical protein
MGNNQTLGLEFCEKALHSDVLVLVAPASRRLLVSLANSKTAGKMPAPPEMATNGHVENALTAN